MGKILFHTLPLMAAEAAEFLPLNITRHDTELAPNFSP
jgi:hypothetical protein